MINGHSIKYEYMSNYSYFIKLSYFVKENSQLQALIMNSIFDILTTL